MRSPVPGTIMLKRSRATTCVADQVDPFDEGLPPEAHDVREQALQRIGAAPLAAIGQTGGFVDHEALGHEGRDLVPLAVGGVAVHHACRFGGSDGWHSVDPAASPYRALSACPIVKNGR